MIIQITIDCQGCDGDGVLSVGDPNDPSSYDNDCSQCGGNGKGFWIEDSYECIEDAKEDYPKALLFTELFGWDNVSLTLESEKA